MTGTTRAMTCRETVARLLPYVEGTLPPRDLERLERHLAACPRCVEFVESYRATARLVRAALAGPPEVPAEVAARLRERLRALARVRRKR